MIQALQFTNRWALEQVLPYRACVANLTLNESIYEDPSGCDHWSGSPAFKTFHDYGVQVHRTRTDAERWNAQQRDLRPAS